MIDGIKDWHVVAVDWSGAARGAAKKIWLADAAGGRLRRLEHGRDRAAIARHLIERARDSARLIVGLDFAQSFPAWFLQQQGVTSVDEAWDLAAAEGEGWLSRCPPPFWGRPGKRRPDCPAPLRQTEREVTARGRGRPTSVFQVGGAGAVGTGSVRGMPMLKTLRAAGFAVWPFDRPEPPVILEIYPRLLTGAVNKSSREARGRYLQTHYPALAPELVLRAISCEDAFDAAVSALRMSAQVEEILALPRARDAVTRLEGRIWDPGC